VREKKGRENGSENEVVVCNVWGRRKTKQIFVAGLYVDV
jgi:hypothetical protein